jgi:hypothetical protein
MSKEVTITLSAKLADLTYYNAESGRVYINLPYSTTIQVEGVSAKANLYKGKLSLESIKPASKASKASTDSTDSTELEGRITVVEKQLGNIATLLGQLVDQQVKGKAKVKAKA